MDQIVKYDLDLTERELNEIVHCVRYVVSTNHGTDGHLKANVIAKLALGLGFGLQRTDIHAIDFNELADHVDFGKVA